MHCYRNIQWLKRIRSGNDYFAWTNENCSWPIDNILWTHFEMQIFMEFYCILSTNGTFHIRVQCLSNSKFMNISFELSITKNNTKIVQHNCRKICQIISLVHRIISNNSQHCCELWWSEWLHFDWKHYGERDESLKAHNQIIIKVIDS